MAPAAGAAITAPHRRHRGRRPDDSGLDGSRGRLGDYRHRFARQEVWGLGQKNASMLATDGTRFFADGELGGKESTSMPSPTGQPLVFGNRRQDAAAGGNEDSNMPGGVAYDTGPALCELPRAQPHRGI